MTKPLRNLITLALALIATSFIPPASAEVSPPEIGVVVMHGKAGSPNKYVDELAQSLGQAGFQVLNLDMPWSGNRHYDVDMNTAVNEIATALNSMRTKGAKKVFVAGHSQGGLFALYYGGIKQVDGIIAIAPGGSHGATAFRNALGGHVGVAKGMIDAGRGNETERFADHEGSKGTYAIVTSAAIYYDWFNPDGPHNMDYVVGKVKPGTPVLYVAPSRDYPALKKTKQASFSALPSHPLTRMNEPDVDHLGAPTAASADIIQWIREAAAQ